MDDSKRRAPQRSVLFLDTSARAFDSMDKVASCISALETRVEQLEAALREIASNDDEPSSQRAANDALSARAEDA